MVQVPISVFRKKRHSSPGFIKENQISSTPQGDGEPNLKRRKTVGNVTDLGVENMLAKPVNKRLLAVTQPASSPKSYNTFRVLLKSANKRKSLIPITTTPKPGKKVISTKLRRSKSLSPQKQHSVESRLSLNKSKESTIIKPPAKSPKLSTPSKSVKQSSSPSTNFSKKSPSKISVLYAPKLNITPLKNKTPQKTTPIKRKSTFATPLRSKTPKLSRKMHLNNQTSDNSPPDKNKTLYKTPKSRSPKAESSNRKSMSPVKSSFKKSDNSVSGNIKSPGKTPTRSRPQNAESTLRKSDSPFKSPSSKASSNSSPVKIKTPGKNPRGRQPKAECSNRKSVSPVKSPSQSVSRNSSPVKNRTPGKTPKGRPSNTIVSPDKKSVSPVKSPSPRASRNSLPVRNKTPGKSPKGRPSNSDKKSVSPVKSPSPRASRNSSPVKDNTQGKTPKGRSSNAGGFPDKKSVSLVKFPSPRASRNSSPLKNKTADNTPEGRPSKAGGSPDKISVSLVKSPSPRASRNSSPVKNKTPGKTPKGRPSKVGGSSDKNSVSPVKCPSSRASRKRSPVQTPGITPRGQLPKADSSLDIKLVSAVISPPPTTSRINSKENIKTPARTPRGRPQKADYSSSKISVSPAKSSSPRAASHSNSKVKNKTPGQTPRGRPQKTEDSPNRKMVSPVKSPSPTSSRISSTVKNKSPGNTPRSQLLKCDDSGNQKLISPVISTSPRTSCLSSPERPLKAEKSNRESLSSDKSPSPKASGNNTPVKKQTPGKTPRRRSRNIKDSPDRISDLLVKSPLPRVSRNSSPVINKNKTFGKTPRGRQQQSENSPDRKSVLPIKSPSPRASRNSSPVMNKISGKTQRGTPQKAEDSPDRNLILSDNSPPPIASRNSSPMMNITPSKTYKFVSKKSLTVPHTPDNESPFIFSTTTPKLTSDVRQTKTSMLRKSFNVFSVPSQSKLKSSANDALLDECSVDTESVEKSPRRSALRSGLSSSKSSSSAICKSLLTTSAMKKTDISKLQSGSKRKHTDFEARAERAAKRLKMETPRSLSKNKVAALLVCHGRSPKSIQKRPLFSEVLKTHLSAFKPRQPPTPRPVLVKKRIIRKPSGPALGVPKTITLNRTGHANSPETIVITKKLRKTPAPKTRKGRKSEPPQPPMKYADHNFDGVPELFRTPSKPILSSIKTATSVKKSQNVRVRFSLQNDVQSPSGKRSFVAQAGEVFRFGSPHIAPKRYVSTPRPSRISESSLMHTSIVEESPLAQEMKTSQSRSTGSSRKKLKRNISVDQLNKSSDFSVYSPSSPTLQYSQLSSNSDLSRKSIDFDDSVSENKSPKRKRSMPSLEDSVTQLPTPTKRISFASSGSRKTKCRSPSDKFCPSSDQNDGISESDLFGSSFDDSYISRLSKTPRKSRSCVQDSVNTSGVFRFSAEESELSNKSTINSSKATLLNVSQIPLPPSPSQTRSSICGSISASSSPSLKLHESILSSTSTRSSTNLSFAPISPNIEVNSTRSKKSKSDTLNFSDSNIVVPTNMSESSKDSCNQSQSNLVLSNNISTTTGVLSPTAPKRVSSTPKIEPCSNITSPINSPILNSGRRSVRKQSIASDAHSPLLINSSYFLEESLLKTVPAMLDDTHFKTPLPTPGKKERKASARMNASNTVVPTPENQVPIATVKPSTRKKQGNESVSSIAISVSLPTLSLSQDVSGRSLDRSLARNMLNSKPSGSFEQLITSPSSTSSSSLDQSTRAARSGGSGRRKRKSSASITLQSVDVTTFDFNSAMTPKVPREMFVSPLDKIQDDLSHVVGVKRILNPHGNSPLSSYVDLKGVKRLLRTPHTSPVANYSSVEGIKDLFKQSPTADYTNVVGVKRLYGVSPESSYMNVKGVRRIFKEAPNSPDATGVEVLYESPKKHVEECNQSSTSPKPVGMVPPMSRLSSSYVSQTCTEVTNVSNEIAQSTQSALSALQLNSSAPSISKQNRTVTVEIGSGADKDKEHFQTESSRKTRRTILNITVFEEGSQSQEIIVRQRGRRFVKDETNHNTEAVVKKTRKGPSTRRGEQKSAILEEDDINEIVEQEKQPSKQTLRRKTRSCVKDKLLTSAEVKQVLELNPSNSKKETENQNIESKSSEPPIKGKPVKTRSTAPEIDRKTRGKKPTCTLDENEVVALGKRKLRREPIDDPVTSPSPPKKLRKGKQPASKSTDSKCHASLQEVQKSPVDKENNTGLQQRGRPRKGRDLRNTVTLVESQSKTEDITNTKSPQKLSKSSPVKSKSRSKKGQVEVKESDVSVGIKSRRNPKNIDRTAGSKENFQEEPMDSSRRVEVEEEQNPPEEVMKTKSRRGQRNADKVNQSPLNSRNNKTKEMLSIPKTDTLTKPTTRAKRGQQLITDSKSPIKTLKESAFKSQNKERLGQVVEQGKSEPAAGSKVDQLEKFGGTEATSGSTEIIAKRLTVKSRTASAGPAKEPLKTERLRRGKANDQQESPKKSTKRKGKRGKEEVSTTEKKNTTDIEERLTEDNTAGPSTRRHSTNTQEDQKAAGRPSRRVKFNMCDTVYSITPSSDRRKQTRSRCNPPPTEKESDKIKLTEKKTSKVTVKTKAISNRKSVANNPPPTEKEDTPKKLTQKKTSKVTVKTKAISKPKSVAQRKSFSPVKLSPAKRVTRYRK